MLFNFWTRGEDPVETLLAGKLRQEWDDHVLKARKEALDGRSAQAREGLDKLLELIPSGAPDELRLAVEVEQALLPQDPQEEPDLDMLQKLLERMRDGATQSERMQLLFCLVQSHVLLHHFHRYRSLDHKPPSARVPIDGVQQEMVLNRVKAISCLGRRHAVVGLVNLHLGIVSHRLRDHDSAAEFLGEAFACFDDRERFVHERSEVLRSLAELAIDLGFLDQGEGLILQAIYCKSVPGDVHPAAIRPDWRERQGIPLRDDEVVRDRLGLARCLGLVGKLAHQQGRLYDALDSYTTARQVGGRARDRGFFVNRVAQLFLEAGAFDLARDLYQHNLPRPHDKLPGNSLDAPIACLGRARAELLRSLPSTPGALEGPHHLQQRRQARVKARELLQKAEEELREIARNFTGDTTDSDVSTRVANWSNWLKALQHLLQGHKLIDRQVLRVKRLEKVRQGLMELARHFESINPIVAGDLLWDLVRLELWAWRSHHYVPPTPGEAFDALLELWEARGARERLKRLQEWAEIAGLADVSRILLNRYLPETSAAEETPKPKPMTILFADLRDSCGHGQDVHFPEDIARLEADLFRAVNPVVRRHKGAILRYQGDSILAVFGRRGEADHATSAALCALELQRALHRLNVFRSASQTGALPLEMPVGIHTGTVTAAHLMIPGRREVTVFGNEVNLAKRIQETPRACPERFLPRDGTVNGPLHESIFVSEATYRQITHGTFRAFDLGEPIKFKGYDDHPIRVFALRPALPLHCSFIPKLTPLKARVSCLALDVGVAAEKGVIDHHANETAGSTTALTLQNLDWVSRAVHKGSCEEQPIGLELIVHANVDIDCCAAVFVALETVEWRPGVSDPASGAARESALQALANYAGDVAASKTGPETLQAAPSPYALFAAWDDLKEAKPSPIPPSWLQRQRKRLERGLQVLHEAISLFQNGKGYLDFAQVFRAGIPQVLVAWAESVHKDENIFRTLDQPRIEAHTYEVPRFDNSSEPVSLRCGVIAEPESRMFKVWAHFFGYPMLVIVKEVKVLESADGTHRVPLRDIKIRVLPDSKLSLKRAADELEGLEDKARKQFHDEPGLAELRRSGVPRPGFNNSDPWFDGRGPVLANTIAASPKQGSVLDLETVLRKLDELYRGRPVDSRR